MKVVALSLVACALGEFEPCKDQKRFDIIMCKSHMCTGSPLDWATKTCQEAQLDFPDCRCEDWPEARKSFSGGDFAGKGKFGDAGDYAKAASAFLSLEIRGDADQE